MSWVEKHMDWHYTETVIWEGKIWGITMFKGDSVRDESPYTMIVYHRHMRGWALFGGFADTRKIMLEKHWGLPENRLPENIKIPKHVMDKVRYFWKTRKLIL